MGVMLLHDMSGVLERRKGAWIKGPDLVTALVQLQLCLGSLATSQHLQTLPQDYVWFGLLPAIRRSSLEGSVTARESADQYREAGLKSALSDRCCGVNESRLYRHLQTFAETTSTGASGRGCVKTYISAILMSNQEMSDEAFH